MEESEPKKHLKRRKVRIRVRDEASPVRKLKHLYRNWGHYVLLAIAVILVGILIWFMLGSIMPTFERPPPSD